MPTPTTPTFLFTDIAGSTRLWAEQREAMGAALARHDALLRAVIEDAGGTVFKTVGDAVCAVFPAPLDAVAAAVAGQRALAAEDWAAFGEGFPRLSVRMALHTGLAESRDGDWFGQPLNRVARLLAAGHGGQVLVSRVTQGLVVDHLPADLGLRDLGEHRLKDLARAERVYQLLAPGLATEFEALRSLDARPNNLPPQLTSFVGREAEVAGVLERLRQPSGPRLLTLTGIGGTGKTRLALEAAAALIEDFPDGVWFVDLAPLSQGDAVAGATAAALGLRDQPDRPVERSLAEHLAGRRLLLVLDNCEHLVQAAAGLADGLLRAAPGLRILATSREPLAIPGEQQRPVPPLAVPDPQALALGQAGLATLLQQDSVQLFTERARALRPDFTVDAANAAAVAQICWRLDGIPLALELAAARVRLLPPPEIARRLDDRFRLLTGGGRTVLPRQQTLQAAIDWSHDLLEDTEQRAFRRLAVFAGWVPLDLVEPVVTGEGVEDWQALDALDALTQKSLVIAEERGGRAGLRLLETVRAYAGLRLAEAEEVLATRGRQLEAYLAALKSSGFVRWGAAATPILDRFGAHRDDYRELLLAILEEPSLVGRLNELGIAAYWYAPWPQTCENLILMREIHMRLESWTDEAIDPWLCFALGACCHFAGLETGALEQMQLARRGFALRGEVRGEAWAWQTIAGISARMGDFGLALQQVEGAVALKRQLDDPADLYVALETQAELLIGMGRIDDARGLLLDSWNILPEEDRDAFGAWHHIMLALLDHREGHFAAARVHIAEALILAPSVEAIRSRAAILGHLAALETVLGRHPLAARLFGAAEALLEADGSTLNSVERGDWDLRRAEAEAAMGPAAWAEAYEAGRRMGLEEALALAAEALADTRPDETEPLNTDEGRATRRSDRTKPA